MRLSMFILGVFAAPKKSAEGEQNYPWCINKSDTPPQCRYTTLEQCLADRLGKGGSCGPGPYPTSPQSPPSTSLGSAKQLREIDRDPPRLPCQLSAKRGHYAA
jgi:uncharacterized protein DUF3551